MQTGVMVALYPKQELAGQIAIPGGLSADQLHITLCYLGEEDAVGEVGIAQVITAMESLARWQIPLSGKVGGVGMFAPSASTEGKAVVYAVPDVKWLAEFWNDVRYRLAELGMGSASEHGWNPHITLGYFDESQGDSTLLDRLAGLPLRFETLTVAISDRRIELPFRMGTSLSYNMADMVAKGHGWRLFVEASEVTAVPEWIPCLPRPGVYQHPAYGEIVITGDRNARFVSQFNAGIYQDRIPVDAEHETKLSGAVGWIVEMRVNADGSADARVEWTERGKKLVEGGGYRYVSPEWYDDWADPATGVGYQDVIVGCAICTRPFFKSPALRPLVASEAGLNVLGSDELGTDDEDEEELDMANEKQVSLTEAEVQSFREMAGKYGAMEAENATLKKANEAMDARVKAMESAARTSRFNDLIAGRKNDGKAWFGETAKHVKVLEGLASAFGEESEQFTAYAEQQNALATQMAESSLFSEIGSDAGGVKPHGESALAKMEKKARDVATAEKITYEQAFTEVMNRDPKLYGEYLAEQRR